MTKTAIFVGLIVGLVLGIMVGTALSSRKAKAQEAKIIELETIILNSIQTRTIE